MALSPTKISKLLAAGEATKVHHENGLYLDVRSSSSASWLFKFSFGGKPDEVGLGSLKKVDLAEAESRQTWCIGELNAGRSPKASMRARKLEEAREANAPKQETIYELAKAHLNKITKGKVKDRDSRKRWVWRMSHECIGRLADMCPVEVTDRDVGPMLEGVYLRTPKQGQRVRQQLAKILDWAYATDRILTPNWRNPVKQVEPNLDTSAAHETEHRGSLPFAEVGGFLSVLKADDAHCGEVKLALEWNVISATRPAEGTGADWAEIDWVNDCWVIPKERSKMKRPHRVPLTDRHHEILELLMPPGAEQAPAAGKLFVRTETGAPPTTTTLLLALKAKTSGATMHGFRTSFGTWARSQMGELRAPDGLVERVRMYDEALIEECLAHRVGNSVRNAYIGDDFLEQRRGIMRRWSAYCGVVQEEKVVQIRRRRVA